MDKQRALKRNIIFELKLLEKQTIDSSLRYRYKIGTRLNDRNLRINLATI